MADAPNWNAAELRDQENFWQVAWSAKESNRLRYDQAVRQGRLNELKTEMKEERSLCPEPMAGGFGLFSHNLLGTLQIPETRLELAGWLNEKREHVEILRRVSDSTQSDATRRNAVDIGRAAFGIGSILFERITDKPHSLSPKLDTAQVCIKAINQLIGLIKKPKLDATADKQSEARIAAAVAAAIADVLPKVKPKRKKRSSGRPAHRPPDTDKKEDKRIGNLWLKGWVSGLYREYADMAKVQGIGASKPEIKAAVGRDRKRRPAYYKANKRIPRRKKPVKGV